MQGSTNPDTENTVTTLQEDSTDVLTTINLPQAASIFTSSLQEKNSKPYLNQEQLKCFSGPIVENERPDDMNGAAENTLVRVKQNNTFEISTNACSKSNFG